MNISNDVKTVIEKGIARNAEILKMNNNANEQFNKMVESGIIKPRGYNLMPRDELLMRHVPFNTPGAD